MAELPQRLIAVALKALPVDPEGDREMVARWNVVETSEEDRAAEPNLPERYTVPVIDDAFPVAREVVRAVLMELATTASREVALQLLDVADRVSEEVSDG